VTPSFVIGRPYTRVRFDVEVRGAENKPLVLAEGITWAAATKEVTGAGEERSAIFTLETPGEAAAVEARIANTTCKAHVVVLPPKGAPEMVRVVVTDDLTGRPVMGATVATASAQGSITYSSQTDPHGVAFVPVTGEVSLTVFHVNYGYLTLARYDTSKGSQDVLLPLRRNPVDLDGGASGTFVNLPPSKELLLGIAGLSPPALGLDLDERQLSASSNLTTLSLLGKEHDVSMPAGAYLSLHSQVIQEEYAAPGAAGGCDTSAAGISEPEEARHASTCGRRIGWALAGELPLTDLKLEPSAQGFDPTLSFAQVVALKPSLLRRFRSSVMHDVEFQLKPVRWDTNGFMFLRNHAHYTPGTDHDFQQTLPLRFEFHVNVPELPWYNGAPLTDVMIQAGADVAGQGMVPLGMGFAANRGASPRAHVHMAPAHHGLEGSPYRLLVIASSKVSLGQNADGTATSIVIEPPRRGIRFDPRIGKPLELSRGFLPIPENARYNFHPIPSRGLQGREFRFLRAPKPNDATLVRVRFTNAKSHSWTVLMDPQDAAAGFRLPKPPAPFEDRTRYGDKNDSRASLLVQMLAVHDEDGATLGPVTMIEAKHTSLAHLFEFTDALSQLNYDRPDVKFVMPRPMDGSVPRGSFVTVRVTDFRVNSEPSEEGFVLLSFEGGTGCEGKTVLEKVDNSLEYSDVTLDLPKDCAGTDVYLTATLVDSSKVPLSPLVSSSRFLIIH
jgi:hypothetical protein